ncbi:hypothetical protein MKW94_003881 [Papaver nudicaule]|uniref:Cupin type-1 domain-containing protein n=1 Tax=Papaver nudicaule TaxID=74823 RepID=A0AA41S001_PAPNU|nr:hypothetical protein [Papaver nudicaule]
MAAKISIKTTSSFFLVLCLTVILFFSLSCYSADPDPLQDICVADLNSTIRVNGFPCKPRSQVTANDFFFSGLMNAGSTANFLGFGVSRGDVLTFPGLNTQGLTVSRIDLAPGGVIPFHTHPRGSQANLVIKGNVYFGFITTTDVLYAKVMKAGELNIIPRGLVHFAKNVGPGRALLIATLNSQLPGFANLSSNLFASRPTIPNDILAKNFRVDEKTIAMINNSTMAAKFSIKTTSSFFLVLCSTVILFFSLPCFSADPDPLQDFCVAELNSTVKVNGFPCKSVSQVTSNDFFFSGLMNEASTANPFGAGLILGDVTAFPGLNTQGLTVSRIDIAPGGIIPLHTHPRASECNLVTKGKVLFGFITTTDVLYSKVMKAKELSIIPRGLVHFAKNVGSGKAVVIAILNSQQPGFSTLPNNLFASNPEIPNDILAKNFRVTEKVITIIKSKFQHNMYTKSQSNKTMAAKFSIKTTSSFFLVLSLNVILFFSLSCLSADPDPLQDVCVADLNSTIRVNGFPCKPMSQVTSNDFFFSGLMNGASTANFLGVGVRRGDVTTFPGLNTQGLTVSRIDLAPGGVIPFHTHPRASEANLVIRGEVYFGFITTTDVLYAKVMKDGELNIIPRGLVHFAKNVGPRKAVVIATLNSQLPGFANLSSNLFASHPTIPNDILAKNFRVDEKTIAIIKSNIRNSQNFKLVHHLIKNTSYKRFLLYIKNTSSFFVVMCLIVILFFSMSCFSADPDPLQDFCVADLNSTIIMNGRGDVTTFLGLNTLGLTVSRVDLARGGIIQLHVHPRASESNYVIKGEVLFGFVSTTDVLYAKVMKPGELSIIPRGLKAVVLAIFNSQLPGFANIPNNLFASNPKIPNDILAKNFRVDEKIISIIKSNLPCFSADSDPLQDFCVADLNSTVRVNGFPCKPRSQVTSNDFFFSGLNIEPSTDNPYGFGVSRGDVTTFPGLNTLGVTVNRVVLAPGGVIPFHTHPRATEINYVIEGEVFVGFVTTTDVLYSRVDKPGEVSVIPRGLVHFVANIGPKKAVLLAFFNSQLPGFVNIPTNLFESNPRIPDDILAKNFRVDEKIIDMIKSKFGCTD